MLFSCFGVLLKVIATNESNAKVVLPKQFIKIWQSYDQNSFSNMAQFLEKKIMYCLCVVYWC